MAEKGVYRRESEVSLLNQALFSVNLLERLNALILLSQGHYHEGGSLVESILRLRKDVL